MQNSLLKFKLENIKVIIMYFKYDYMGIFTKSRC